MKKDDFHEKVLPIMLPNFQLNNETFELLKRYHAPLSQRYSRNLIARFLIKFFTKKSEQEVQFDSLWKYLTETKLLSYQKLKDEKYKDLYSHIGIYDEDIWNAILKVREYCAMGESLTQQRRVRDEGFRVVNLCQKGRTGIGLIGLCFDGTFRGSTG